MPTVTLPNWARVLLLVLIAAVAAANHTVAAIWPSGVAAHVIAGVGEFLAFVAVLFGVRAPVEPPPARPLPPLDPPVPGVR